MEPSFEKKQTVKGVGQFLQLVGDSNYERYKKYWSKINTCSNITSILPLTETFQCLGKMARNIFVTRPRDDCQPEIVQLKTLEVVLSEGGDELARNMGELLQRAGDAMNEDSSAFVGVHLTNMRRRMNGLTEANPKSPK
uniref:Uncharacterized protein n=1 Tax=Magallana gigas TaxID=29159 RepID=A0A8W8KGB9_MAGGI